MIAWIIEKALGRKVGYRWRKWLWLFLSVSLILPFPYFADSFTGISIMIPIAKESPIKSNYPQAGQGLDGQVDITGTAGDVWQSESNQPEIQNTVKGDTPSSPSESAKTEDTKEKSIQGTRLRSSQCRNKWCRSK